MTITKTYVEKFDRNMNFGLWQMKMKAILVQDGAHKALLGKEKKPEKMTDDQFDDMDEKACSCIILNLTDQVIREVAGEKTAKSLWDKLESLYMKKTIENRLYLKQSLYMLRMSEGTSITSHLDQFDSIIMDLENVDVKIDEEDKAVILLCSLPSSLKHFRDTMLYGKETISYKDIKSVLKSKELIDKDITKEIGDNQAQGLYVGEKGKYKNLVCNYCHKNGHIKSECFKLKNKKTHLKDGESGEKSIEADVAVGYDGNIFFASHDDTKSKDEWILNSGCTYHICSNKDLFETYEPVEEHIILADNTSNEVVGKGRIRINMDHGGSGILNNVRYVPNFGRNFISLGTLDALGFRYTAEGGVMKIYQNNRLVMKGCRFGKLYILQGSAVTGIEPSKPCLDF